MPKSDYGDLLGRIDRAEIATLCSRLIQFNSVNPPGNEGEIAQYIATLLQEAGLTVEMLPHSPERASLIARLKGSGEMPALVFSGHLDTLPISDDPWQHAPFGGEISDGKVWGRGGTDMKGGDTALITVAKILAAAQVPLKGDLILVFSAGEEEDQMGAWAIAERLHDEEIQAMLIPEPTENEVEIAEKGALWLEITTHGKAGHISRIDEARNAIEMMIPLLSEFAAFPFPHKDPLLGVMLRSINMIQAGQKVNTIPDRCVATVEMRTVPGQDHEAVVAEVEQLIADAGRRLAIPDFCASVKVIHQFPPVGTSPQDPIIQRFCDVVAEATGTRPAPRGRTGGTDACVFIPIFKVPFAVCGPGTPTTTGTVDEWVDIDNIVDTTKIYLLAATQFLA